MLRWKIQAADVKRSLFTEGYNSNVSKRLPLYSFVVILAVRLLVVISQKTTFSRIKPS